jgi:5-hydroxyisourate hydrolase-like protein (transthyretin family)
VIHKIAGKVIEKHTGKGIPNVRVEAVKEGDVSGEDLGFAITDNDGRFAIAHDEDTLEEQF